VKKINSMHYTIVDIPKVVTDFLNLAGRFPQRSSWCNEYVLVACNYDANHIRAKLIKNRKEATITKA